MISTLAVTARNPWPCIINTCTSPLPPARASILHRHYWVLVHYVRSPFCSVLVHSTCLVTKSLFVYLGRRVLIVAALSLAAPTPAPKYAVNSSEYLFSDAGCLSKLVLSRPIHWCELCRVELAGHTVPSLVMHVFQVRFCLLLRFLFAAICVANHFCPFRHQVLQANCFGFCPLDILAVFDDQCGEVFVFLLSYTILWISLAWHLLVKSADLLWQDSYCMEGPELHTSSITCVASSKVHISPFILCIAR